MNRLPQQKLKIEHLAGLGVAILAVSTASIMIRFAQATFSSLTIAAFRLGIASLALAPFYLKKKKRNLQPLSINDAIILMFSGVLLAAHFASWIKSLEMTNVISSVVLGTTTPIWVSLLSFILLNEKLKSIFYAGLLVSLTGVIVISLSDMCDIYQFKVTCEVNSPHIFSSDSAKGNLLALTGAFCAAGYILCGKKLRLKLTNLSYIFPVYVIASLLLIFGILILEEFPIRIIQLNFIWIVLIAIIPQLVGHSLINWSLGHFPASYVSLALLGEPVGSALLALIFLGDKPMMLQILGSIMVLLGIIIASR